VAEPASSAVLVVTYEDSYASVPTFDWQLGFPYFDRSLGTLTGVQVDWKSSFSQFLWATYYDDLSGDLVPYELVIDLKATRSLDLNGQVLDLDFTQLVTVNGDSAASWETSYGVSRATSASFSGSQLASFLGDGNLIPATHTTLSSAVVEEHIAEGALGWSELSDWGWGETLTFTYTYTAAVPEPASWALMLGGFGAIGVAMRRRRMAFA
jgi:hypothetical protein